MKDSLCWFCENNAGGCSWAREFKPVQGWNATPSVIPNSGNPMHSYHVEGCPKFKRKWGDLTYKQIAEDTGINVRTVRQRKTAVINFYAQKGRKVKYNAEERKFYEVF